MSEKVEETDLQKYDNEAQSLQRVGKERVITKKLAKEKHIQLL